MYSDINGLNLYYQKIGKGKNLIVLHGWGNDVSSFWPIVNELRKNFTLYLIDLPGFGRSSMPNKAFTVDHYAQVVYQFINKEQIKNPVILGHSVGGRIGIKLASKYPDILDKLILESSAGIKIKKNIFNLTTYIFAKIFRIIVPNIFNIKEILRVKFYKSIESDYLNSGDMNKTLDNIVNEDLTSELKKIKVPTLLIWGEDDPTRETSLKNCITMYQLIPDTKIVILENVGHFPHIEKGEIFNQYVKDFC